MSQALHQLVTLALTLLTLMRQLLQIAEALALILVLLFLLTVVMDGYDLIKTVSLATVFILREMLGQMVQ